MKKLNKLELNIYWIFIISLIIDNINGILLLNKIDLVVSIGQIYRYFMILFFGYYIIKTKFRETISKFVITSIYTILLVTLYFVQHYSIEGLIMDITYVVKLIYPFVIIYALYGLYKRGQITGKVVDKIFSTISILGPLSLIIPRLLNIGYDAYDLGGYKGFYFSNNEINVLLVCTFIYSINKLYETKSIKSVIISILNAAALFLIGSKTSIIAIAAVVLIYVFKMRKNKKLVIATIVVAILACIIGSVIFSKQINEMNQRFNYFYRTLTKNGGILTFLMSERNIRIAPAFEKNVIDVGMPQGIINFMFGIGRYQQVDPNVLNTLMELDLFDTFYWYGFITAFIIFKKYIEIFVHALKTKSIFQYKLMFCIVFAFSMIAGHVWYSALAGQILALVCVGLLTSKNKKQENE